VQVLATIIGPFMTRAAEAGIEAVLQHDNAPPHQTAEVAATRRQWTRLLQWPPHSPDLSVIELVWNTLDQKIMQLGDVVRTKEALCRVLAHLWRECTTPEALAPYYAHVWEHMQRVVDAGGSNAVRD
jgi:hypothetical protein